MAKNKTWVNTIKNLSGTKSIDGTCQCPVNNYKEAKQIAKQYAHLFSKERTDVMQKKNEKKGL